MELEFESILNEEPDKVWSLIASGAGINQELAPILRMTSMSQVTPENIHTVVLGERLGRSWLLLFGFLPIGFSDVTLIDIKPGKSFIEQSPMVPMKQWKHERTIEPNSNGTVIFDKLTFEPLFFSWVMYCIYQFSN